MNLTKKLSVFFLGIVVLAILTGKIVSNRMVKKALPDYNTTVMMPGLEDSVKVFRDEYGIPHIYAQTNHDLYQTTGYLMAQDRLWQMDLLRRVTLGRLSEIFDSKFVEVDLLFRSLRFSEKSNSILQSVSPEVNTALDAFAAGVNYYIHENKGSLPFEFSLLGYEPEKWEPYHSLNLIGYMAWDLKSGWNQLTLEKIAVKVDSALFAEVLPDFAKQKTFVYGDTSLDLLAANKFINLSLLEDLGLDIFDGSNNWAVSGSKSTTGKPLLANDMHLSYNIPGIWMQMHQVVEGELNVTGLILPGQPLIIVGHNDSIAWGMTNTYVDNLDFYEEKINPLDSNQYWYNGDWHNFSMVNTIVKTKEEELQKTYRYNHRGPVVSSIKKINDRVLTIRWIGDEESDELTAIYKLNRANNWEEFKSSFRTFLTVSQNVVYADKAGNIGLYCCAGVPVRKRDKLFGVLPGWTDEYDWKGLVPFDELPHEFNPEQGFVSSANNRLVDDSYPYHLGVWYAQPYRIDRIRKLLVSKEKFSVEDFKIFQNDQVSEYAGLFLQKTLPSVKKSEDLNDLEREVLEKMEGWDYSMTENIAMPAVCEVWTNNFIRQTFEDEMGEDVFKDFIGVSSLPKEALFNILNSEESLWYDNIKTENKESLADISKISFKATVSYLAKKLGKDIEKWQWGQLHTIVLKHPIGEVEALNFVFKLNQGPFAVGGSYHTIAPYSYPWFSPDAVNHGASHRNVYDLSNWNNCYSVIPTGISGIPASKHYCDQTEMYINGEYHSDPFSYDEVLSNALYRAIFLPGK